VTDRIVLAAVLLAVPAFMAALLWCVPRRWTRTVAIAGAFATGGMAVATAAVAVAYPDQPHVDDWVILDAVAGLLVGVIGIVGLISVLVSPAYLNTVEHPPTRRRRRETTYFTLLYAFWAALLAVPVAGNLGTAWLLVEATTAASALLVGFSGKRPALEAGWKYLVLTSLGLGVALLGIALLAAGVPGGGLGGLSWRALSTYTLGAHNALVVYLLLLAGLAAKIGWAPVHNWLPDAHSEAPAPVSAMLSAALLPAVLLVAWRCEQGMAPVVGSTTAQGVLVLFGLVSVAVAVAFLSRPLVWKRLLAYSSLEHMGVIALGAGFATPLATAGVVVHVVAHAIAKSLGFYAATPLLAHEPDAAYRPVTGVARTRPALAAPISVSLGALAGLPPSPLFASELLIVAGGFQSGWPWAAAAATTLLALAFLGLARALIEVMAGDAPPRSGIARLPGLRGVMALTAVSIVLLLALAGLSVWLPTSDLVSALMKGFR
jgi:hydrogenase-4 component F